jgi:hypothetical protein
MPLHTIRQVAELLPEVNEMVKQAALEGNYETDSKDHTIVSALELAYLEKIAHRPGDYDAIPRVDKAVDLYEVRGVVADMTSKMIKAAQVRQAGVQELGDKVAQAEGFIHTQLAQVRPDMDKIASACESLVDNYSSMVDSDIIKIFAGAGTMSKIAAVEALKHRADITGEDEFTKIAQVVASTDPEKLSVEDNRAIYNTIRGLEKSANYFGPSFYKDCFMVKQAACSIKLHKKSVPAESLIKVAEAAGAALGDDIGQLLKEAHQMKDAIEALPLGELQVLESLV